MTALLTIVLSSVVALQNPQIQSSQVVEQPKPMGKISGVVTRADTNKPLEDVVVRMILWEGGFGKFVPIRSTDANGRFLFDGLVAGSYSITFSADRVVSLQYGQKTPEEIPGRIELKDGQFFDKADISLPPTTAIEGRLVDEFGDPVPGVRVQPAQVQFAAGKSRVMPAGSGSSPPQPTDDLGRFRIYNMPPGNYYLVAVAGPFAGPEDPAGFAVTYYPGTSVPMEAQPVQLELGKDLSGLVFRMTPAPMATISGVLTDDSGKPISGSIRFLSTSGDDVRSLIMGAVAVGPDGVFRLRNVAPGTYVIQAYGRVVQEAQNLGAMPFGYLTVKVPDTGDDIKDLQLKIPRGAVARGRILFDGDGPPPTRAMVSPSAVNFVSAPVGGGPPNGVTREDWTFEVNNMSGLRMIRVNASPARWQLKQVTLNGRDITDEPVDFRNGDVNGLEITLTSRGPVLTGSVTDDTKTVNATLVVFSIDPSKWAFPSRHFAQVRPAPDGFFQITGLPPGNYLAVALPTVQGTNWQDPEFLKQHLGVATHLTLTEGSTQTIALKVYRK